MRVKLIYILFNLLILGSLSFPAHLSAQNANDYIVTFMAPDSSHEISIVQDCRIYTECWDTLAQTRFWQRIMTSPIETSLVNIAQTRQVLGEVRTSLIDSMDREEINTYKDSVREVYGLDAETKLYITSGRDYYYKFQDAFTDISHAVTAFESQKVDPWYAQAILLIESPGRNRRSRNGAYGPFQLMRGVAKDMGLIVTSTRDDRGDIQKSAKAAAKFLQKVCIPRTEMILDELGLAYDTDALWFRLLVLHVYHAGYGNVRGAMQELNPRWGGPDLIQALWQTTSRRFGNASQNYSQVILASMVQADAVLTKIYLRQCNCCP